MKNNGTIRWLFIAACLYDGILGLLFVLIPKTVFDLFGVEHPNHMGYIQFPALILLVFSVMFLNIARNPQANQILIPYSILFKLAYAGVVVAHWVGASIPDMWKPFAIADLAFAGLFYLALRKLARPSTA